MKLRITVEGKTYEVDVEVLEQDAPGPIYGSTSIHSSTVEAPATPKDKPASDVKASVPSAPAAKPAAAAPVGDRVVKAPIVGTIVQLKVAPGDYVEVNQVLLVMEAMKMETNVATPLAGKVKTVRVSPGEAVKAGQVLVELE
jgi:methylmalonyl-CoA carboxyltransferase small subunit